MRWSNEDSSRIGWSVIDCGTKGIRRRSKAGKVQSCLDGMGVVVVCIVPALP